MSVFKTEAEAWDAIADTLEMIESMPPSAALHGVVLGGFCATVFALSGARLISYELEKAMIATIENNLPPGKLYFAPPGHWKPRVAIARKFAEQARTNS